MIKPMKLSYKVVVETATLQQSTTFKDIDAVLEFVCKEFLKVNPGQAGADKLEQVVRSSVIAARGHGYNFQSGVIPIDNK